MEIIIANYEAKNKAYARISLAGLAYKLLVTTKYGSTVYEHIYSSKASARKAMNRFADHWDKVVPQR